MASPEVLALPTLKARVWKHLHDVFVRLPIGYFYSWAPKGDGTLVSGTSPADRVTPTGFIANETAMSFEPSANHRTAKVEPSLWEWQVILTFNREVLADEMNLALCSLAALQIPSTPALPHITLTMTRVETTHPPMQDPTNGSILRYSFNALIGRR